MCTSLYKKLVSSSIDNDIILCYPKGKIVKVFFKIS